MADKYADKTNYHLVEEGIYEFVGGSSKLYVTSLSFVQEPEYGEAKYASDISQYPLEDILDKYYCHITDFYEDLNTDESRICYLEFASEDKKDIIKLREIIGKHVYNEEVEENDTTVVKLMIE